MAKYRIKERREELKMTQSELIERTGLSRATISLLENNGEVDIKVSTLTALAEALECQPSALFCVESPLEQTL